QDDLALEVLEGAGGPAHPAREGPVGGTSADQLRAGVRVLCGLPRSECRRSQAHHRGKDGRQKERAHASTLLQVTPTCHSGICYAPAATRAFEPIRETRRSPMKTRLFMLFVLACSATAAWSAPPPKNASYVDPDAPCFRWPAVDY